MTEITVTSSAAMDLNDLPAVEREKILNKIEKSLESEENIESTPSGNVIEADEYYAVVDWDENEGNMRVLAVDEQRNARSNML